MPAQRKHDWQKLRKEWLSGKYRNLVEMAKRKKMSHSTLEKRALKERWTERRAEIDEKVEQKIEQKIIEIKVDRQIKILEQQMEYSKALIGLGFSTFRGKKRIAKESDALRSISLGMEAQVRALRMLREDDGADTPDVPAQGDIHLSVNIANVNAQSKDLSNDQIALRLQQISEERKRISGT